MKFTRYLPLSLWMVAAVVGSTVLAQDKMAPEVDASSKAATEPASQHPDELASQHPDELASQHPNELYPQIVRLSLVQGDVRVAVGKVKGQPGVAPWVAATVNMPLETGFSVVTGKGRAEIEFEDASTMYLGENSVLAFDDLSTQDNVPYTEMTLLTGVATLHLHPDVAGEMYLLKTPTDFLRIHTNADVRVNSYTDAMTVTPVLLAKLHPGDQPPRMELIGKTFRAQNGGFTPAVPPVGNNDAAWDAWVAKRVAARTEEMHTVMKEAGLSGPLPGLEDMNAKGTFFACKPYGTCWVPNKGWGGEKASGRAGGAAIVAVSAKTAGAQQDPQAQQGSQAQQDQQIQPAPTAEQMQNARLAQQAQGDEERAEMQTGSTGGGGGVAPVLWTEDYSFPCSPYGVENLMGQDPITGQVSLLDSEIGWDGGFDDDYGFDWAVCHAGSWIRWHHRYAWVAGRQHHHRCPVRWVKVNGRQGYVPLHPHDTARKEPGNLRNGVFMKADRKGGGVQRVAFDAGAHVKLLGEAPRGLRELQLPTLRAATAPSLEARSLRGGVGSSKAIAPDSRIAFDSRARGFTVTTQSHEGGHSHMVVDHFGGGISGGGGRDFSGGGGRSFGGGGGSRAFGGGGRASGGGGGRAFGGGSSSGGRASGGASSSASSGGGGGSHASGGGGAAMGGGGSTAAGGGGGSTSVGSHH